MPDVGTIIVTGAAGAIGSATVDLFLESGWFVLGLDKAPGDPETRNDRFSMIRTSVSDEDGVIRALRTLQNLPPLHHVIAVAGGALETEPNTKDDPLIVELEQFRSSIDANLTSQFITVKSALPWLRKNPDVDRSVTLTSSFNAISGYGMPAYSAAKAGLVGMMNSLVGPLGEEGIRINTVAPGTIRTPRTERIWAHVPDHFQRLGESAALGTVGEPLDVARGYRSLAVDLTHVTGHTLVVDGGQLKYRPQ